MIIQCMCVRLIFRPPSLRVVGVRAVGNGELHRTRPDQPLRRQPREIQNPKLPQEIRPGRAGGRDLLPGRVGRLRPQTLRAASWEIIRDL